MSRKAAMPDVRPLSPDDVDRTSCMACYLVGDASEEFSLQESLSGAADDDDVYLLLYGEIDDFLRRIAVGHLYFKRDVGFRRVFFDDVENPLAQVLPLIGFRDGGGGDKVGKRIAGRIGQDQDCIDLALELAWISRGHTDSLFGCLVRKRRSIDGDQDFFCAGSAYDPPLGNEKN